MSTTRRAAIVACAGWKGVGCQAGLAHVPAAFLPLNNRITLISKLSAQLKRLGFTVFIAVGPIDYPFKNYQSRVQGKPMPRGDLVPIETVLKKMNLDPNDSPWTRELYDYAQQHGTVLPMGDPGWSNQHDTFCRGIDRIGNIWNQVLLVCGDTIFSDDLINGIAELAPPCQYQMHHAHSVFLLDKYGVTTYRNYAEKCRKRWMDFGVRPGVIAKYPDGRIGTNKLMKLAIKHYGGHNGPQGIWYDIDGPGEYETAKMMVGSGGLM